MPNAEDLFAIHARSFAMSIVDASQMSNQVLYGEWKNKWNSVLKSIGSTDDVDDFGQAIYGTWKPRQDMGNIEVLAEVSLAEMTGMKMGAPLKVTAIIDDVPESRTDKYKVDNLAMGLFGIYTRSETEQFVRDNITQVFNTVWNYCDEDTKNELGIKYARFSVNGEVESTKYAKDLFTLVDGQSYLPEELRITEIDKAIDLLYQAHEGGNNFYTEPTFASQLKRLVGENKVPAQLKKKYVMTLILSSRPFFSLQPFL